MTAAIRRLEVEEHAATTVGSSSGISHTRRLLRKCRSSSGFIRTRNIKTGKNMIIGIDFDGTCVTHEFPEVGKDIGAQRVLRRLVEAGHQLVLFTMRSDKDEVEVSGQERMAMAQAGVVGAAGNHLSAAVGWFVKNDIPLWGVNENPTQKSWTSSPKPYCHFYIDDSAIGIPMKHTDLSKRPYVDWEGVEECLEMNGVLPSSGEVAERIMADIERVRKSIQATPQWKKYEPGKSELKDEAIYLVKCPNWSEAGMSVAIWTIHGFDCDHPNIDRFNKEVTHYLLLEER